MELKRSLKHIGRVTNINIELLLTIQFEVELGMYFIAFASRTKAAVPMKEVRNQNLIVSVSVTSSLSRLKLSCMLNLKGLIFRH
jgi:hypothetical protein